MNAAVRAVGEARDEQDGWTFGLPVERYDRRAELSETERLAFTALDPKALRRNRTRGIPRRTAPHCAALEGAGPAGRAAGCGPRRLASW
jgi:hypothetical protein